MLNNLTIIFENERALMHFKSWMCGSGEQSYWEWMEARESEEDGNITALNFNYHGDIRNIDGFNNCRYIEAKCGRMDLGWEPEPEEKKRA